MTTGTHRSTGPQRSTARGKHRGPQHKSGFPFLAGVVSVLAGAALAPVAIGQLYAYSPYGNPAAGELGFRLGILSLLLAGVPVLFITSRAAWRTLRRYFAWKRTLTPELQLALTAAEVAVLLGAHHVWHEHNKKISAALTESVMGEPHEPAGT